MSADDRFAHLCGVLAHELRNPLAGAMTGAMLVRELVDDDDPRRSTLDGVLRDLGRVDRLLRACLDLHRTGRLQRESVPASLLAAAVTARQPAATADVPADLRLRGDRALLERALENLVENALHAGARTVHVTGERIGDMVRLTVDDDGPGVAPELAERIFTAGFSARGSTGLGLAIVATTVAAHGGVARCEARAAGGRFVLELPAATPAVAVPAAAAAAAHA